MKNLKIGRCQAGESVYEATKRIFGPECSPVIDGIGVPYPKPQPNQVGEIVVRPREAYAVVRKS